MITMSLFQILEFTIHGKIWKSYTNNKFKISDSTWNDKFKLPNESYSLSDIQECFEYIKKKQGKILIIFNKNINK